MRLLGRLVLASVGIYVALFAITWFRFDPRSVEARQRARIALGASAADVSKTFGVRAPFDIPEADHCNMGMKVSRIAISDDGGFWFFPLPLTLPTTTTFCFDSTDHLIGLKATRWLDGP